MSARGRSGSARSPVPIRALYPLHEIAAGVGLPRRRVRRFLEKAGVQTLRVGLRIYIPLGELETKVPLLWDGIKSAEAMRRSLK